MFTAARLALVDFLAGEEACDIINGQALSSTRDTMIHGDSVPGMFFPRQDKERAAAALRQQQPMQPWRSNTCWGCNL